MKLIAESGATKTDWRMITDDGQVRTASTPGLNPSVLDEEQIRRIISPVMHVLNPEGKSVHEIYFYGDENEIRQRYVNFPTNSAKNMIYWAIPIVTIILIILVSIIISSIFRKHKYYKIWTVS